MPHPRRHGHWWRRQYYPRRVYWPSQPSVYVIKSEESDDDQPVTQVQQQPRNYTNIALIALAVVVALIIVYLLARKK